MNRARRDLCGGRPVTGVPTAIRRLELQRNIFFGIDTWMYYVPEKARGVDRPAGAEVQAVPQSQPRQHSAEFPEAVTHQHTVGVARLHLAEAGACRVRGHFLLEI